jgi:hypothetical protein
VVGSEIGYIIGGGINICGLGAGHPKNPTCGLKDALPADFLQVVFHLVVGD